MQIALEGDAIKKEQLEKIFEKYFVPNNINNLRSPKNSKNVYWSLSI